MKTKDVPQDLKYFKDKVVRDVMYAVDEDGRYTKVLSDGWSVKNDVLAVVWDPSAGVEERSQSVGLSYEKELARCRDAGRICRYSEA